MRISYDSESDAVYIRLVEGEHQCRTLRLTDEIALNVGEDEMLVGIEIVDATNVLGGGELPPVILENIPFQVADLRRGDAVPDQRPKPGSF
jgi:uncharacterized protein YuzE